jgi:hypothetical protein
MGSTFSNVVLQIEGSPDKALGTVRKWLERLADGARYRLAGVDEEAERTLLVVPAGRWLAVYDEGVTEPSHSELAVDLSKLLGGFGIVTFVNDSSVLGLSLYRRGRLRDVFISQPQLLEVNPPADSASVAGDTAQWQELVGAQRVGALKQAFDARPVLAEQALPQFAELLGIDARWIRTGYGYLTEDNSPPPDAVAIRLVSAVVTVATAATEFAPAGASFSRSHVGETWIGSVDVRNLGRASTGLSVYIAGSALEDGLVEPLELQVGPGAELGRRRTHEPRIDPRATWQPAPTKDGSRAYVATLPELPIAAAIKRSATARSWLARLFRRPLLDPDSFRYDLSIIVRATAQQSGRGSLAVHLRATGAPALSFGGEVEVDIRGKLRRPLKCAPDTNEHMLEPLAGSSRFFVLTALGPSCPNPAEVALELARTWISMWPDAGPCRVTAMHSKRAPTELDATSAALFGKHTQKLRDDLTKAEALVIEQHPNVGATLKSLRECHGVHIGKDRGRTAGEPTTLVVLLWLERTRLGDDEVQRARQTADQLCRQVMGSAGAAQALVGSWGEGTTPESSSYESVCGIGHGVPMRIDWQRRFVRGVTADGPIWLGPELIAALGDQSKLAAVAALEQVGDALRVVPHPGVELDLLEQALAPILPSAADSEEFAAG